MPDSAYANPGARGWEVGTCLPTEFAEYLRESSGGFPGAIMVLKGPIIGGWVFPGGCY